uniref:TEA domain transcription factor 1 n=1 Tax=Chelydra serpentina TaxID=8475 RepID=A0A8C3XNF2_CHESE
MFWDGIVFVFYFLLGFYKLINHNSTFTLYPLLASSVSWSGSESPAEDIERMSDSADKPIDNDAEGVWSPDIEQSFQEALAIYPPCGRRKIILSDEGKMYGRNELIARYIKLRTGKTRTRKQVKQPSWKVWPGREGCASPKQPGYCPLSIPSHFPPPDCPPQNPRPIQPPPPAPHPLTAPSRDPPTPNSSPTGIPPPIHPLLPVSCLPQPLCTPPSPDRPPGSPTPPPGSPTPIQLPSAPCPLTYNKHLFVHIGHANHSYSDPLLESVDIRQIYDKFPEKKGGLKELFGKGPQNAFFLVKFWADLNCNIQDDTGAFYGVTSQYESSENMTITCSTKVCSFGKQVVEKVETEYARFENGRFVYRINRSPMCEYMINFIHKLKHLPEKYMMNSVLENFTILLVVTNRDTQETLLCMACVFEVSNSEHGAQHHIYRLVKD